MTGDHIVKSHLQSLFQHGSEFQMGVALDTGIGCQAIFVGRNKLTDHMLLKFRLERKEMVWDSQFSGNSLGIRGIIRSTAAEIMKR